MSENNLGCMDDDKLMMMMMTIFNVNLRAGAGPGFQAANYEVT